MENPDVKFLEGPCKPRTGELLNIFLFLRNLKFGDDQQVCHGDLPNLGA